MPRNPAATRSHPWGVVFTALCLAGVGVADEIEHPLAPADTSSPRATLQSYLTTLHKLHEMGKAEGRSASSREARAILARRAMGCLDLSEIPPAIRTSVAKESGILLKEVLDRVELPAMGEIPGPDEAGEIDRWRIPNTEITLVRMTEGPQSGQFLFSSHSVARAREYYERVERRPYVQASTVTPGFHLLFMSEPGSWIPRKWVQGLPSGFRQRWAGQAVWQWIGLLVTLLLTITLMIALYLIGRRRTLKARNELPNYLITLIFPIAAMFVPVAAQFFVTEQLQIYGQLVVWVSVGLQVTFLAALTIFIISLGNRLAESLIATPWIAPSGMDAQITRLICRLGGIAAAVVVLAEGGRHLGIPLATLLTGASVGGLAVALAAQDTLKSILGSMTIMLDKPYRVGEHIVAMGYDGMVDEIGLRSTTLRLFSGSEVCIPNEEMASESIENFSRSPYRSREFTVDLSTDTPPEKTKRAVKILREILEGQKEISEDHPPSVCLSEIGFNLIRISGIYRVCPLDYWAARELDEKINLEILERFSEAEVLFSDLDAGVSARAEEKDRGGAGTKN